MEELLRRRLGWSGLPQQRKSEPRPDPARAAARQTAERERAHAAAYACDDWPTDPGDQAGSKRGRAQSPLPSRISVYVHVSVAFQRASLHLPGANSRLAAHDMSSAAVAKLADDRPASITSVTHINSFSADQTKAEAIHAGATPPSTLAPAEQLARLGEGSQAKPDISGFVRNPKLVKEDIMLQRVELGSFRDALDAPGRLAHALLLKDEANLHFAQGRWRVAMVGYLTGLWLLRSGRAACPLLASAALATGRAEGAQFDLGLGEVAAVVGAAEYDESTAQAEGAAPLCASLHLNLAATALKASDWPIAKAACERVLATDETHAKLHAKATFRLAKAHEGAGEGRAALAVLAPLLKREPQNGDARRLHEALRRELAEERGRFKGLFAEAEAEAPTAVP